MLTIYSTGCPNCNVLERTVNKLNIETKIVKEFDQDELRERSKISSAPVAEYEGNYYNFYETMVLIKALADEGKI